MIDLGPPPQLIVPKPAIVLPAPAIIRPRDRLAALGARVPPVAAVMPGLGGAIAGAVGGASGLTIAFRSSATSSGSTITGPSDIESGDILVLRDYASHYGSNPTTAIPSGFTSIVNYTALDSGGFHERNILSYKLADGSEASATLTGMNGDDENFKVLVVFSAGAITLTTGGAGSSGSNGNPSALAINASGGTAPLVVIGGYSSTRALTEDSMTPTEDGRVNVGSGGAAAIAYKIYNAAPANVSIDMGDEDSGGANFNVMTGAWIEAG